MGGKERERERRRRICTFGIHACVRVCVFVRACVGSCCCFILWWPTWRSISIVCVCVCVRARARARGVRKHTHIIHIYTCIGALLLFYSVVAYWAINFHIRVVQRYGSVVAGLVWDLGFGFRF